MVSKMFRRMLVFRFPIIFIAQEKANATKLEDAEQFAGKHGIGMFGTPITSGVVFKKACRYVRFFSRMPDVHVRVFAKNP